MLRSARFWVFMAIFQVAFGLMVFAITRNHYIQDPAGSRPAAPRQQAQPAAARTESSPQSDLEQLISTFPGPADSTDPFVLGEQADDFFVSQQFDRAADLYAKSLALDPGNVDTFNNLGLTLHYLGRSTEALEVLNEGVTVDPGYQRIWLTLGFVNSQTGNIAEAQSALTTTVQLGADTEVGRSAAEMLRALGPD